MGRLRIAAGAALVGACFLSPAVPVAAAPTARDVAAAARLAARVDSLRVAKRIPGLAIVVLRDTTVVLARGFGFADVAGEVPVTPDTPFNIASVTKPLSAVVALRLVEAKQLDLDRPMSSYLDFVEFCEDAREQGGIFFADFECQRYPLTMRHILSMTANGPPGTRFWYNPVSYSWASRPMMQVSGSSYSDLVRKYVLEPAGMTRSARSYRALPLPAHLAADLAKPYHVDSAGAVVRSAPPPPQGDGAAGGVIATAADLARFDVALGQGRLISKASRKIMWTPTRAPNGKLLPYGIGWFVTTLGGERLLWHTGVWDGAYSALYLKAPDRRTTLILLANSDGLGWPGPLDGADVGQSSFARAFLEEFAR